jgi:hypothetical protein
VQPNIRDVMSRVSLYSAVESQLASFCLLFKSHLITGTLDKFQDNHGANSLGPSRHWGPPHISG